MNEITVSSSSKEIKSTRNEEHSNAINVAALDIGSNSFHLVVARIIDDSVQVLHKVKQKVRLANGLDDEGYLSEEAIVRGLNALKNIKDVILGFHPDNIRIVATYTLRKAVNANEFIHRAMEIFDYPVEVISGFEEARLIYSGVAHTHHDLNKRLVIDIGGGSTEFIIGEEFTPHILRSMPMGCVSFNKHFFEDGYITKQRFRRAVLKASQILEPIVQLYKVVGWENCIGTSGSIKSILAVCTGLLEQENSQRITRAQLETIQIECCEFEHVDQLILKGLSEDRKPVFCAGLSILIAIFNAFEIESLEVSSSGLRDGVLYEMEDRLKNSDIRQRTAESLSVRYNVDTKQAKRVQKSAMNLYDQCAKDWGIDRPELLQLLNWATLLHEVGLNINSKSFNKHSAYIIANVDLPGFNQEQQLFLSELLKNQCKKIDVKAADFEQFTQIEFNRILVILRLSVMFNITRQESQTNNVVMEVDNHNIKLIFKQSWIESQAIFQMDLMNEIDKLEMINIQVQFSGS